MSEIIYRKLQKSDFDDIMKLIDDAWNFDNYINNEKCKYYCIRAFMLGAIINQNYTEVAVMDGEVVGLIFGKIPKLKGFLKNIKYIPGAIYAGNRTYFASKENKKMIKSFINMQMVYKELLKKEETEYDGELEFFIVHSKAQGKGVGKTLWKNYKQYCINNNIKKIYVYTDENCNFGFYDHNGFVRKQTMPTTFNTYKGEHTFNVFLYSKDID